MNNLVVNYGIGTVLFDNEEVEHPIAHFGDGKTQIGTAFWDNACGLFLNRNESLPAFTRLEFECSVTTDDFSGEKMFITFDNPKSIDGMVDRLLWLKKEHFGDSDD